MKKNTQPALNERIEKALEDFTKGRASMHVPPLDTDVDVVLAECSDRLSELEARCAALAAENAGIKAAIDATIRWQQSTDPENVESVRMLVDVKTPATEVILADVMAQGVEMFAEVLKNSGAAYQREFYADTGNAYIEASKDAVDFADQLRKGVQS